MCNETEPFEILSNYIAVTALEEEDQFGILLTRGERLRTPAGKLVQSDNYSLMLHMVRELEEHPVLKVANGIILEPRSLCSYLLFSTQIDFVKSDEQINEDDVGHLLKHDPILYPSAGPERTDQLRSWGPIEDFLDTMCAKLRPQVKYPKEEWETLVTALTDRWNRLSDAGKSVVHNLHALTEGHLIASLAFASQAINHIEFGHAVLAGSLMHHTFGFPNDEMTPEEQHSSAYRYFRDFARVCGDYLAFFPHDSIALIVESGESSTVEFKSSLRWDLRQDKKNDAVTYACLKTIAAFLNTNGGRLLIGVADDGTPVGIEIDKFPTDDRFLLHLYGIIKSSMGTDVTTLVEADIDSYNGKKVCVVHCKQSQQPIYLKAKGKSEEFYIRTGPSSDRLEPRDLVKYISERFDST